MGEQPADATAPLPGDRIRQRRGLAGRHPRRAGLGEHQPRFVRDVWHTTFSIQLGHWGISQDLRGWVNSGLMTFFFFVVGLEARREFDMGDLRQRRRVLLPVAAGVGGMLVPIGIYLAINAGRSSAHAWGVAMSTDTAFALGLLALVGRRIPDRVRAFLLTVVVVDDVVALVVIAIFYSEHIVMRPLAFALGFFVVIWLLRARRVRNGLLYALFGDGGLGIAFLLRHRSARRRPRDGSADPGLSTLP